jgi:Cu-Zn family superoxide dismutase
VKKQTLVWLACLGLVFFAGCGGGDVHDAVADAHDAVTDSVHGEAQDDAGETRAIATIEPKNDSGVTGTASFTVTGEQVILTLSIENATPGEHAFHLHEVGDCSAADGTSAGGHWNPADHDHGQWGGQAFHLGDVGNLEVGADGTATLTVATNLWSVGTGDDNDVVGRAVIVHAGADDFTSQPTGAAGGRIGCGVIQLVE